MAEHFHAPDMVLETIEITGTRAVEPWMVPAISELHGEK